METTSSIWREFGLLTCLAVVAVALTSCQMPSGQFDNNALTASGSTPRGGAPAPTPTPSPVPSSESCPVGGVKFTHPVTDISSLYAVTPLPALAGGVIFEGRSYMAVRSGLEGVRIPVYAPTRMTLFASKLYRPDGAPPGYLPEWALAFSAGCGVTVGFAHVKEVVSRIEAVNQGTLSSSSATVSVSSPVRFEAGEVIGYYIKGTSSIAWDFIVQDENVTHTFANQARYVASNNKLLHVICPYSLFEEPHRSAFEALLGSVGGGPVPGTRCGTVSRDRVGTAAGAWYADTFPLVGAPAPVSDGSFGNHFSVFLSEDGRVYFANLDNTYKYVEAGAPTHRDPETVSASYCYQLQNGIGVDEGWVYLNVVSSMELQVAYSQTGLCPFSFPVGGYKTFYR